MNYQWVNERFAIQTKNDSEKKIRKHPNFLFYPSFFACYFSRHHTLYIPCTSERGGASKMKIETEDLERRSPTHRANHPKLEFFFHKFNAILADWDCQPPPPPTLPLLNQEYPSPLHFTGFGQSPATASLDWGQSWRQSSGNSKMRNAKFKRSKAPHF